MEFCHKLREVGIPIHPIERWAHKPAKLSLHKLGHRLLFVGFYIEAANYFSKVDQLQKSII